MLTPSKGAKVLDFGVAMRLPSATVTSTQIDDSDHSELSGTLAYMAPEVLQERESSERSDIFSLGVVFYEALAGRHPFLAKAFWPPAIASLKTTNPCGTSIGGFPANSNALLLKCWPRIGRALHLRRRSLGRPLPCSAARTDRSTSFTTPLPGEHGLLYSSRHANAGASQRQAPRPLRGFVAVVVCRRVGSGAKPVARSSAFGGAQNPFSD